MGKQLRFYLTPADTELAEGRIRECDSLCVLHSRSSQPHPRVCSNLDVREDGKRWLFLYLVRETDLGQVVLKEVPAQQYWAIDSLRSPVIEFNCCFFDGLRLRSGRIYYTDGFYGEDGVWIEKPTAFLNWAKCVFSAVKKISKSTGGYYVGADAKRWLEETKGKLIT